MGRSKEAIRIVIATMGVAALLLGCESKTDRQAQTEPESPLLLPPQSPLLMDYKEIPDRSVEDVSGDGKYLLAGWGDSSSWTLEVINTESTKALGQLKGKSSEFGVVSKFLPGSNHVLIEEHILAYKLWEFRKNHTIGCNKGTEKSPDELSVGGEPPVRVSFVPDVCVTTAVPGPFPGMSGWVSAVSPDGSHYLTNIPTLRPYKQIEVRRTADFEIAGRIDAGNDRLFEDDHDQPPRYTADGQFIVAVVQTNQDDRRWYLNIYRTDSLQLVDQIDITSWNPRKDRIAQKEDSLTIPPHFGPMIVVSPDRRIAVVAIGEHSFRLFDLRSKRELAHTTPARPPFFFTPDGSRLVTDHAPGVRIWNLEKIR